MTAWSTDIVYVPKKSTTPDVTSSTSVILNTVEPSTSSVSTSSFPSPSPTHSRQAHEGLTQPDDWRQQMLDLVNKERTKVGKAAVQLYNKLNQMAQAHTQYQFDIKTMTHNDTKPLGQRATDLGIRWSFLSENVAFGYKSVQDVMQGWINSPGHYHNIIGNANYAGFGVVDNFWSQNFAMVNAV
ncbi:hypothetical protein J3B02_000623 [Coemansia erecta]|nr:hypothetical protein J3B02_000623 [Coemansia erecta]